MAFFSFDTVPFLALLLLNLCLLVYVARLGDRMRSGFFLVMSGLALILWSGGTALMQVLPEHDSRLWGFPFLGALLVPANFLYFAVTRRTSETKGGTIWVLAIYLPAVVLTLLQDFEGPVRQLMGLLVPADPALLKIGVVRAVIVYSSGCLLTALTMLAAEYTRSSGPEQVLYKQLIGVLSGPLLFAACLWAASAGNWGRTIVPSPPLLFAIMAQGGLLIVLRQEQLRSPRLLSRLILLLAMVLLGFVLVAIGSEFYWLSIGGVVLDRAAGWTLLVAVLLLVLLARLMRVDQRLDALLFERAADYRRIVDETHRELVETRARLRHAERLSVVGELVARVAHEIKNPLMPIKGYTQLMTEKIESDLEFPNRASFLRHLSIISEEVENIDRRVRALLDTARPPELAIERVDVNRLAERCSIILQMEVEMRRQVELGYPGIEVRSNLHPEAGEIEADASRVEEALFNLLRNAAEALSVSTEPGQIVLQTTPMARPTPNGGFEQGVELAVEDNGPGLSRESKENLYIPFSTRGKPKGTGLGLSNVQSIVKAHSGVINNAEVFPHGTRFTMWFPSIANTNPGALLPRGGEAIDS
jgi:signal transduction histidine kinase